MRFSLALTTAVLVAVAITTDLPPQPKSELLLKLEADYEASIDAQLAKSANGCTKETVVVRKEWSKLSREDRENYVQAVFCMQKLPPLISTSVVNGVRNAYDDFVAVHINQSYNIHQTALFLPWHRYFTWSLEQRLRNDCGYKGYQPYWDWTLYSDEPKNHPLFDGSDGSIGGTADTTTVCIPDDSLFGNTSNFIVNLGPWGGVRAIGDRSGFDYNPRCLTRFINNYWSTRATSDYNVTTLLTSWNSFQEFELDIDWKGDSVHTGGHFTFAEEPMSNTRSSPGDIAFFFHHAQVDRMWAIWQSQNPATRTYDIWGTSTSANLTASANVTMDYVMNLGVIDEPVVIRDTMSTIDGKFCYRYE